MRFEPTHASKEVLLSLTENPCVLITGPFGSGKTAIVYHIISELKKTGYIITVASDPSEIVRRFHRNKRQLFVMDDILGKKSSNLPDVIDKLEKSGSIINSIFKKSHTVKVLLTCRTYMFQLYAQCFESLRKHVLFIHKNLISEDLRLKLEERKGIYKCYFESDPPELIPNDILLLYNFYPKICSSYNKESVLEYFKYPERVISTEMSGFKRLYGTGYLALAIIVVLNNRLEIGTLHDMSNSDKTEHVLFKDICEESCFNQYQARSMLQMTFMSLKGEFIKDVKTFLSFLCPEMFDIVTVCIGGSYIQSILKHSSSVFIREKLELSPPQETHCVHTIKVPRNMESQFYQRLASDMNNNFIIDVLNNKVLQSFENRKTFVIFIQKYVKSRMLVDAATGSNVLHIVSELGYSDLLHSFLTNGLRQSVNKKNIRGKTPIHLACQNGNKRCVEYLIENKSKIDEKDGVNKTALHYACEAGVQDIVKYLISNNTSINNKDSKGMMPLHIACEKGHIDIVKCLVEQKAKLNATDNKDKAPLHYACEHLLCNIAEVLILNKAHVNKSDEQGYTPLHIACKCGNEEMVKLLVEHEAVTNIKDIHGKTPLDIALENSFEPIYTFIFQCKTNR